MSHRTAFALSATLALLFAVGVIVGRDRLFAEMNAGGIPPSTPSTTGSFAGDTGDVLAADSAGASPRIIEIPLSDVARSVPAWASGDDDHDRARYDNDDHEHLDDGDDDRDEEHDDD